MIEYRLALVAVSIQNYALLVAEVSGTDLRCEISCMHERRSQKRFYVLLKKADSVINLLDETSNHICTIQMDWTC